ncbi:MAG: hypothetical protein NTY64_21870 [Deltaproteobacteria bacterium]|nr:hypothetical protein [Deltaproteobacteria bacterium]
MPCILRRCGVLPSTPHSSGIVRLASGAFYFAIHSDGFAGGQEDFLSPSSPPPAAFGIGRGDWI